MFLALHTLTHKKMTFKKDFFLIFDFLNVNGPISKKIGIKKKIL